MRHHIHLFIFAFAALFHGSLLAQNQQDEDPHSALAIALSSDEIAQLRFEQDLKVSFYPGLKKFPEVLQIEKDCPGYIKGYGKALTPIMYKGHMEDNAWYRVRLEKLLREKISKEHAAGAASFYGSELGQNFLAKAVANMTADNTVAEIVDDDSGTVEVSAEAYGADRAESTRRLIRDLSEDEKNLLASTFASAEWFPPFIKLIPEVQALGLAMLNRQYSEEHYAKIDAIAQKYTSTHVAACEAYQE